METRNIFFAAACGALLGFTSCSQQEPPLDEAAAGPKTLTIKVGAETTEATRVTTTDGLDLKWQLNDEIAVVGYDDGGVVKGVSVLTTSDDSGSSSATFTGDAISGATQYKVYFPKEAVDLTTGETRYQACLNELTASSAADVKVILASDAVAGAGATIDVTLKWESALLEITLSNLTAPTTIDKVNFAYETALGWSVDHPLKFTASQTVSATPKVYIPFIPDGGVKAGGKILVSVYDGPFCWDYSTASSGKIHHKGYRYKLAANYWMPYTGFTISSTVWAEANVGASGYIADPAYQTDYGYFFQWGRDIAWSSSMPGTGVPMPGWDNSPPTGNDWNGGLSPCPNGWRLPTKDEFDALANLFTKEWKTNYKSSGTNGYEFTDTDGHRLFFPAAGWRDGSDGSLINQGGIGGFWSATPADDPDAAWGLDFFGYGYYFMGVGFFSRSYGRSVRCVQD